MDLLALLLLKDIAISFPTDPYAPHSTPIDFGAWSTEVAVLCLVGTVFSDSVRLAGDELIESFALYL